MKIKLRFCDFKQLPGRNDFLAIFETPYGEELSAFISAEQKARLAATLIPGSVGPQYIEPYRKSSGTLGISVVFPDELADEEQF